MNNVLFLIGAGFNLDANSLIASDNVSQPGRFVGLTHDTPPPWELAPLPLRYPSVRDLVTYCFGPDADLSKGAEQLFMEAYIRADWVVLNRLTTVLHGADNHIATPLVQVDSVYSRFFDTFPDSTFISYNYDCFIELFLQEKGKWNPQSGFGITAEVYRPNFPFGPEPLANLGPSCEVIHVHGSLYLYPVVSDLSGPDRDSTQWLTMRSSPRFVFAPESLASSFPLYTRPPLGHGYTTPEARFVPPIADKEESVEQDYYRFLFDKALGRVRESNRLIAIGYSFAPSDASSYDRFLKDLFFRSGTLLVVAPPAQTIAERLKEEYKQYSPLIEHIPMTFSEWGHAGFPKGQTPS